MERFKPSYMGAVMPPPDDSVKLKGFLSDRYEQFNKFYDLCKDLSESISSVERIDSDDNSLSIKIVADLSTLDQLRNSVELDPVLSVTDTGIIKVDDIRE